jgi:hypothetical protein
MNGKYLQNLEQLTNELPTYGTVVVVSPPGPIP